MELIAYMRLRNKMTQKEWEDSFEKKEREIIVLRHEGGGGSLRTACLKVLFKRTVFGTGLLIS